ncbi:hypothetical protein GCM10011611_38810 [Aliidongia dinghuensis]|uniref:Uncharacterized protein n=1 Tax=Aliidongia dinghuensis TaxID=1867774 RepID=A0A8J3E4P8_9PROT|nr:hypothetical protein [Aliidongia dinghuensis]GGF28965.1 hypothetical protein GCM10011611_38810 [Aliidongia dinghuensis]
MARVDPWRYAKDVHRVTFPGGLEVGTPRGHAVLRYKDFRKIFIALYIMRRQDILPRGVVALRGARNQFDEGHGTRAAQTQGAHNLPRQLIIGNRTIEDWLHGAKVDECFVLGVVGAEAVATVLPDFWNKADSLWEQKGLAEAFLAAAAAIVSWTPGTPEEASQHFKVMWRNFHAAAGAALALALQSAAGQRLAALQMYEQVHWREGAAFDDDPPSLTSQLSMTFT